MFVSVTEYAKENEKRSTFSFRPTQALGRYYMAFNLTKTKWYWGYSHNLPLLFQLIRELLYCQVKILRMEKIKFFFCFFAFNIMGGFHRDLTSYMKIISSCENYSERSNREGNYSKISLNGHLYFLNFMNLQLLGKCLRWSHLLINLEDLQFMIWNQ